MKPAPSVRWAVETRGLILVNDTSGASERLGYPEAAVWDLAMQGYARDRLVRLLAAVTSLPPAEAEALLDCCLGRWAGAGWIGPGGG